MKQNLQQFFTLVRNFTNIQGLALKGAAIVPLICIWTGFGPPHSTITNSYASILELIALIAIFQLTYGRSPHVLRRMSLTFALLFGMTAVVCTYFGEVYVRPVNEGKNRVVIGTQLRDDIAKMIGPVYSSPEEALRDSGDPYAVWTTSSVNRVILLYELDWALMLLFFTASIVTFVMASGNDHQVETYVPGVAG
jgi:hypothetical protein